MSEANRDDKVTGILEAIGERYPLKAHYRRYVRCMIDGLDFVKNLPPIAAEALRKADKYWRSELPTGVLAEEKERLWAHIDGTTLSASTEAVCRAVLCVLEELAPTDDGYDLLDWYLTFMRDAGVNQQELLHTVQAHLPTE